MGELLDLVVDAYDYLMNTNKTYRMLGETVGFFERSMQRNRNTIDEEAKESHGFTSEKRWHRLLRETLVEGTRDNRKCFPEEETPAWISHSWDFYFRKELLRLALSQRDRWKEGR